MPTEFRKIFNIQAKRGPVDGVSLDSLDKRWRHLARLPEPKNSMPADIKAYFDELEAKRKTTVAAIG